VIPLKANIGDMIFVPYSHGYSRMEQPCSICNGNRSVELILGTGEHQHVACDACVRGYGEPTGVEIVGAATCGVRFGEVTGVAIEDGAWIYTYSGGRARHDEVYLDHASAQEIAETVLLPEEQARAQKLFEALCQQHRRKVAWTAGYHRAALRELRRKMDYHESKLRRAKP
jgi:hypothetical protein